MIGGVTQSQTFIIYRECSFPHLVWICNCHVDGNGAKRVLQDLSREDSRGHTRGATLVKSWHVVVFVIDGDLYLCCGVGKHSVDVFFRLGRLKINKLLLLFKSIS